MDEYSIDSTLSTVSNCTPKKQSKKESQLSTQPKDNTKRDCKHICSPSRNKCTVCNIELRKELESPKKKEKQIINLNPDSSARQRYECAIGEGDLAMRKNEWQRAVNAYTKALQYKQDKNVLLARSRCYVQLGQFDKAIEDADATLRDDENYWKGILQKAEALYAAGQFEFALVYYYKGNTIRKDVQEFDLGIKKATMAIKQSIEQEKIDPKPRAKGSHHRLIKSLSARNIRRTDETDSQPTTVVTDNVKRQRIKSARNRPKSNALGELKHDQHYLRNILNDKVMNKELYGTKGENEISKVAADGLDFLDRREEFWRQKKPETIIPRIKSARIIPKTTPGRTGSGIMSARRRPATPSSTKNVKSRRRGSLGSTVDKYLDDFIDYTIPSSLKKEKSLLVNIKRENSQNDEEDFLHKLKPKNTPLMTTTQGEKNTKSFHQTKQIVSRIHEISRAMDSGDCQKVLSLSKELLSALSKEELDRRPLVFLDLYNLMGTAYARMRKPNMAIIYHQKALDISVRLTAMANIFESLGQIGDAIRMFEKKRAVPPPEDQLLQLYEDLGRCYYKISDYDVALAYMKCALEEAIRWSNEVKQLTLNYSIGVTYYELSKYRESITYFEKCVELSKKQGNLIAQINAMTSLGNAYMGLPETDENISKSLYYQKMAMTLLKIANKNIVH